MKYWKFADKNQGFADTAVKKYGVSELVGNILSSRGISLEEVDSFLKPNSLFHDPFLMLGMDKAVEAIHEAVSNGSKIAIFGDYDCDGVTATAMLYHYLEQIGADIMFYIPNREGEGYGISSSAIKSLHAMGIELIITVDNGISAIAEAELAKELGMQLVITDHHTPRDTLPEAAAIINPHQLGCNYPFKQLCGAGVVFKLICALESDEYGYEMLEEYSDLLTIGTIADVVELRDENRLFVKRGLESMANTHRIGLQKLIKSAGINPESLDAESVSFGLAPRINAAGRIDSAEIGVLLLLTEIEEEADEIIEQMEECNNQRKLLEKQIIEDISSQMAENSGLVNQRVMVFSGKGWNAGVAGIVCSRLVSRFDRPCIIISIDGDEAKASGRSIEGFSLIDAIFSCTEILTKYGGHPMAAGFSMQADMIGIFVDNINCYAKKHYPKMPVDTLKIHHSCNIKDLSLEQLDTLNILEPFGSGNEKPNFCVEDAVIEKIVSMTDNKHQRIHLEKNGEKFTVMFFSTKKEQLVCLEGDKVDVAFCTCINIYNGERRVTLKGLDIRPSGLDQSLYFDSVAMIDNYYRGELKGKDFVPTRDDIAIIYRYFKAHKRIFNNPARTYFKCSSSDMSFLKFKLSLEIMLERNLLLIESTKQGDFLTINPNPGRVSLEASAVVRSLEDYER